MMNVLFCHFALLPRDQDRLSIDSPHVPAQSDVAPDYEIAGEYF